MRTFKLTLMAVVICYGLGICSGTVFNLLQLGTGTAATYSLGINTLGTALTVGAAGAFGLGALSGLASSRRRRYRYRNGRSLQKRESDGIIYITFEELERLDEKGCFKRLLCQDASQENKRENEVRNMYPIPYARDLQQPIPLGDQDVNPRCSILEFIEILARNNVDHSVGMEAFLSAIENGKNGANCKTLFPSCDLEDTDLLEIISIRFVNPQKP